MLDTLIFAPGGLESVVDTLRNSWIGPAFIILVLILALIAFWRKSFRSMMAMLALAIIAGLLIYRTEDFVGSSGSLTNVGGDLANQVANAIAFRGD